MYSQPDHLFGHLTIDEKVGNHTSRSFHIYKNSSNFDFEHSDKKSRAFKREHDSINYLHGMAKTTTNFNDFNVFSQIVPPQLRQRDASPGMRYFGAASGYSPYRKKVDKDYDLSPNFTMKGKRPQGVKDAFTSSIF